MLEEEQVERGYFLTCAAVPTSDCTVYTHQEEQLYVTSMPTYALSWFAK